MHVLAAIGTAPDDGGVSAPAMAEMAVLPLTGTGHDDDGVFRRQPRGFVGLDSSTDVVSVEVVDLDVTPHVVMSHVRESISRHGQWDDDQLIDTAALLTAEMLTVADQFPVGTILDRDGRLLHARVPVAGLRGRTSRDQPDASPRISWPGGGGSG